MNISLTYSKFSIHHLSAIAAACSQSVHLCESDKNILSMGPHCEEIQSQNAITCLILNYDPTDLKVNDPLLWEVKFLKPYLYHFYKKMDLHKIGTDDIAAMQKYLDLLATKFGSLLEPKVKPFELVLWSDLYLVFSQHSPFVKNVNMKSLVLPPNLFDWFIKINELAPLRKAVKIAFGENETAGLTLALKTLPNLSLHQIITDLEVQTHTQAQINNEDKIIFLAGFETVAPPRVFNIPKLPLPDARNILITSALPYVNNVPHLGNLIGSTLSADIFSRYCRLRGYNSIYVCGTDEYGTATEVKAVQEKSTPRDICNKYHAIHSEVYQWFGIDFDIFGRTSDEEHATIVTEVFLDIYRRGFILEDSVQQLFCESCDKFLADRFVEGVCPTCGYEDARGDQCDKCSKLINTIELKNPRCKVCTASPCVKTTKHLFLDLSKIQGDLETFLYEKMNAEDCIWSTNAKSITKSWLQEGLKPRCISRDLKWGVKVPLEEFSNKVFYVWFDAVLGYLSITASYSEHWKQWWLEEEGQGEVELYQFMAKDNVPFHSVMLPANLIATGKRYNKVKQLASVEYLNYENVKFSKSRGLGVFGLDAKESGIEADVWRFYLAMCRPESQDSSFLWDDFSARNNSELLNNLGNFVNRALSFVVKFFEGRVPDYHSAFNDDDLQFIVDVNGETRKYIDQMEQTKMRDAVGTILNISRLGNAYFQRNQPWVEVKRDDTKPRAATVVGVAANVSVLLAVLLSPIMPTVSARLLNEQCKAPASSVQILGDGQIRAMLLPGHVIGDVAPLFAKMDDDLIAAMKQRFGSGDQ